MASAGSKSTPSVLLICGEDEFAVKQRARQVYKAWCEQTDGMDHEIIDAGAAIASEALAAIGKLREALQTLPFFGSGKVVWFQNCSFLGDERAAQTKAVTETLAELAEELKRFAWGDVRLLITAGKVDKRRIFYKTVEKIGQVELFAGWNPDDRNWSVEAEEMVRRQLRGLGKQIAPEALSKMVAYIGPNSRQLASEAEKLALYAGDRSQIHVQDVEAVITRNKQSRAFALADALGSRDLPRLLRTLDQELWEMKTDSQKTEIGILYGLISKVRTMIFLKEMQREGWLKGDLDYARFKAQLAAVPAEALPQDKRFNPLAMHPYLLFNALDHSRRYTLQELIGAMELLLRCNHRLISSGLEGALILQQTLVKIVSAPAQARLV